ncbi:GSCFA domain-containing protein [Fibrobacter sp. UBA4309]|uniref:GSCFA domain-containing protein n=1 Tax=Fibrobacter sp. UBA4309 TaxID=1946537 RepID=UPI0025C55C73|nr:GSCFA domain-containing protein [Fibrobacter sp. UBA4309]
MEFFTKVDIPALNTRIDYTSRIAFFGSCFADNISAQFSVRKFNVLANPFGTVYNPRSIARQLRRIADGKAFGNSDVFKDERCDKLWHSFDAHSSLSANTREDCIANLNAVNTQASEFLQKADIAFITLGTAFVYYLKDNGKPVSNCHRQDPSLFERRMISVEEASKALEDTVASLRRIHADIQVVFTVSPLRHMADGAHGNNLSKSTLLLAIEQAAVDYFPSYEIVLDELRDYRFYDSDMVHLSKTAEEYIFERMVQTYCDSTTRTNMERVEKFLKTANHKIAAPDSDATRNLVKKILAQATELESQIEGLHLDKEREFFANLGI